MWRWARFDNVKRRISARVDFVPFHEEDLASKSSDLRRKNRRWEVTEQSQRQCKNLTVGKRAVGRAAGLGRATRSRARSKRMLAGRLSPRACRPARAAPAARGSPCLVIARLSGDHTDTLTHKPRLCSACFLCSARLAPPWHGYCACVPCAVCPNPRVCARAGAFWGWSCSGVIADNPSSDRSSARILRVLGL